ncbi:uncharacterized protein LOC119767597 isoform X2 [Culex quinquefasciatus]|uniref:uncharacterized protein LOC119767597 isoform X2 n=1 Tax=Culex quinquefasciatus TaxID=7176 RepID=UPI0018E3D28B|nr:uncharacterized protein LOC119767597 isoform X2 [Culex quinquefasciatus]
MVPCVHSLEVSGFSCTYTGDPTSSSDVHFQVADSGISIRRWVKLALRLLMKRPKYVTMPTNRCTSLRFFGWG